MKENWEYKRLGEVCCSKSAIERATKIFESNSEILYIDIASIDNQTNCISSYTRTLMSKAPSRAQQCVKKKDVLVSLVRPNLKNVAMLDEDENNFVASSGFCILRSGEKILPKFIFKFVCSETFTDYLVGLTAGANYPAVREDDVRNALIPIPPLDEQEQIVAELDLLSDVIDKQKAELRELDNLAQSTFYDMFGDPIENPKGWETRPLNEVAPQRPYEGTVPDVNGKYWLLNLDKVVSQSGDVLEKEMVDLNEIGNSVVAFDSTNVLYSKLRPYLNKVVIPNDFGYATSELVPLKPNRECLDRVFLTFLLRSKSFVNLISVRVAGAKMPRVSMDFLRNFEVILPPLDLQQSFADKIASIEKQKAVLSQSIVESQKLLDYTMDKYFG